MWWPGCCAQVSGSTTRLRDRPRPTSATEFQDADPEDIVLLEDLVGIRDPAAPLPDVAPDAQRRRLTALINSRRSPAPSRRSTSSRMCTGSTTSASRCSPTSLRWCHRSPAYADHISARVPRSTDQIPGAQTIALRPLSEAHSTTLTAQLLGADPPLSDLAARVAERAGGNPFFAEEMVRDLAERGVLDGRPGAYKLRGDSTKLMSRPPSTPPSAHASTDSTRPPNAHSTPRRSSVRDSTPICWPCWSMSPTWRRSSRRSWSIRCGSAHCPSTPSGIR